MFAKIRLWSMQFNSPMAEAIKEAVRDTLLGIPSILIQFLPQLGVVEKTLFGAILFLFLRALDKKIYEKSKIQGRADGEPVGGLSPI